MDPTERFSRNLREHRERKGMSQEALGDVAGIHMTEVSRLERGVREPRLGTIVRLARGLGVKPARLLEGVE